MTRCSLTLSFIVLTFAVGQSNAEYFLWPRTQYERDIDGDYLPVILIDDRDYDGIPDKYEQPGESYLGLPLYDWGARQGQTDIFVEIDYMQADGSGEHDSGLVPSEMALHLVKASIKEWSKLASYYVQLYQHYRMYRYSELRDYLYQGAPFNNTDQLVEDYNRWRYQERMKTSYGAYGTYPIEIHFDVGDLFHQREGIEPSRFDLGGGGEVPWSESVGFRVFGREAAITHPKEDYYDNYMDPERRGIFYYMLFGTSRSEGGAGEAQFRNVISTITLNELNMEHQSLVQKQALIIMHELGHNLGLRHGGHDDVNLKPFYYSAMNYHKIFESQGFYLFWSEPLIDETTGIRGYTNFTANCRSNRLEMGTSLISISYSLHQYPMIDERYLNERPFEDQVYEGWLYRAQDGVSEFPFLFFDVNCDGQFSDTLQVDLNNDGFLTSLSAPNDWNYLYFFFHHNRGGDQAGAGEAAKEFVVPPF